MDFDETGHCKERDNLKAVERLRRLLLRGIETDQAFSRNHARDRGIGAAIIVSQEHLLPVKGKKMAAANESPAGIKLFALGHLESGGFQHAAEKQ